LKRQELKSHGGEFGNIIKKRTIRQGALPETPWAPGLKVFEVSVMQILPLNANEL